MALSAALLGLLLLAGGLGALTRGNDRRLRRALAGLGARGAPELPPAALRRLDLTIARADAPEPDAYGAPRPLTPRVEGLPPAAPLAPYRPADTPATEYITQRPQRTPTVQADVLVPALQALLTGLAAAIVAGLLAWALGWSWRVPVILTALTLALAWLWRLRLVDGLLWRIETLVQRDLTGDRQVGPPHELTLWNPADARTAANRQVQTGLTAQAAERSDTRRAELIAFLNRCYVSGTSEASHGITAGGPARQKYLQQREVLFALGLAEWRDPARPRIGWRLRLAQADARALVERHVLAPDQPA